jgi:hypothetical protein
MGEAGFEPARPSRQTLVLSEHGVSLVGAPALGGCVSPVSGLPGFNVSAYLLSRRQARLALVARRVGSTALGLFGTAWLLAFAPAAGSMTDARPQPSIKAFGAEWVVFPELPCQELAPARLTIELFEEGSSERPVRTFTLDNPCAPRWTGNFRPLPNLVFAEVLLESGPGTPPAIFLSGRGKRQGTVKWPIHISRDGAVIEENTLVLDIKRKRQRVYEGRKAFRTPCVRKHRRIRVKGGRRYCLRPVYVRNVHYEGQ